MNEVPRRVWWDFVASQPQAMVESCLVEGERMSELSEYLEGTIDFSTFSVESLESANKAMRALANAQRRIDERRELVLAEARKLDDWFLTASKSDQQTVTFFTESLKNYMVKVRQESGEKSLSLPDGEISSRSIPAKAQVSDLDVFLKWCLENGREAWIRTKESADLEALKEGVEFSGDLVVDVLTGEAIDGLVGVEADISVKVSVTGQS